jgi:hypothetical protein
MTEPSQVWQDESHSRIELDDIEFNKWFDDCSSEHEFKANSVIDFYHRILTPRAYLYLGDPREKTCLEIGYGGGRLLNQALNVFKHAVGIDIHHSEVKERVERFLLKSHDSSRFDLKHNDDVSTTIANESIDFAYSFIVFQHFDSFSVVEGYVNMLSHVLKTGGLFHLFYVQHESTFVDAQAFGHNKRAETLKISHRDLVDLFNRNGFKVVDHRPAGPKKMWNPNGPKSSQHEITVTKI